MQVWVKAGHKHRGDALDASRTPRLTAAPNRSVLTSKWGFFTAAQVGCRRRVKTLGYQEPQRLDGFASSYMLGICTSFDFSVRQFQMEQLQLMVQAQCCSCRSEAQPSAGSCLTLMRRSLHHDSISHSQNVHFVTEIGCTCLSDSSRRQVPLLQHTALSPDRKSTLVGCTCVDCRTAAVDRFSRHIPPRHSLGRGRRLSVEAWTPALERASVRFLCCWCWNVGTLFHKTSSGPCRVAEDFL